MILKVLRRADAELDRKIPRCSWNYIVLEANAAYTRSSSPSRANPK